MVLIRPMLPWLLQVLGADAPGLPPVETEVLYVLLANLLGFGGYRTFERVRGKA
jgi:hypothetical protein